MKKLLLIKYLPKGENSNTKILLDHFLHKAKGVEINVINLLEDIPGYFSEDSMNAYIKRNYMGEKLPEGEGDLLKDMDRHTQQLLDHDYIVICAPMHNFGVPGAIKAWIDHVVVNGVTFGKKADGTPAQYPEKKCLGIFTSGGNWTKDLATPEYPNWDLFSLTLKINFSFMGFGAVEVISSATNPALPVDENYEKAKKEIDELVDAWQLK